MTIEKLITIDGPSGSGKGTISRLIAKETGFELLDSGALYRLTALAAHNLVADMSSETQLAHIAGGLEIAFVAGGENTQVFLNEQDVTDVIRQEQIGMWASQVAAYPKVREALLQRQRSFLTTRGLIADGRDMGTVVFPAAPLKVFLTASAEIRAQRRVSQLKRAGIESDYAVILADIEQRDERDRSRKVAPLIPATDAHVIDCSALEISDVVVRMKKLIADAGISIGAFD